MKTADQIQAFKDRRLKAEKARIDDMTPQELLDETKRLNKLLRSALRNHPLMDMIDNIDYCSKRVEKILAMEF